MTLFHCLRNATAALLLTLAQSAAAPAVPRTSWTRVSAKPAIQGNAAIAVWAHGDDRCFEYPRYTVSESSAANTGNEDAARFITTIAVRAASTPCRQIAKDTSGKPVFVIKKGFEFFKGLAGTILITDSGSGPDPRTLTLYAINKQSKILEFADYSDSDILLKNNTLIFWHKTSAANQQNCPQYKQITAQGFGAVIESQVVVDLTTHQVSTTSKRRCESRQSRNL